MMDLLRTFLASLAAVQSAFVFVLFAFLNADSLAFMSSKMLFATSVYFELFLVLGLGHVSYKFQGIFL